MKKRYLNLDGAVGEHKIKTSWKTQNYTNKEPVVIMFLVAIIRRQFPVGLFSGEQFSSKIAKGATYVPLGTPVSQLRPFVVPDFSHGFVAEHPC